MYKINVNETHAFEVQRNGENVELNGADINADVSELSASVYHIIKNNKSYNAEVVSFNSEEKTAEIKVNNQVYMVTARDEFDLLLDKMGLGDINVKKVDAIKAPMPGLVLKLFVEAGAEVKKGDSLFILEAMKMENMIKSPADGTVSAVNIKQGDKVEKGQVMISF